MSIDLKIELAKQEYINTINEINKKYDMPITISEFLLKGILDEVTSIKNNNLIQEQKKLENEQKEKEENKNKEVKK